MNMRILPRFDAVYLHQLFYAFALLSLFVFATRTTAQNLTIDPPLTITEPPAAENVAEQEKFRMIIVFRDASSLLRVRAMCTRSPLAFELAASRFGLLSECHMPSTCKRIYSTALFGFSGEFTSLQLEIVQRCLPGSVWYKELDVVVRKAEDESMHQHPQNSDNNPTKLRHLASSSSSSQFFLANRNRKLKQQQFQSAPTNEFSLHSFEEPASSRGEQGPILDINSIAHGIPLTTPSPKSQSLTTQLWNLDRLDQKALPLDDIYTFGTTSTSGTGKNVTIYVIDSGILMDHQEFQSSDGSGKSRVSYGYDFVEDKEEAQDCDGHGTHLASSAAGLQVGVAKDANIVAVRILDCSGSGSVSNTVAALDWVAADTRRPAVAILSLGIEEGSWSRVLEDAVRNLIVNHSVSVVVASGNSAADACNVAPANVPEAITVSATSKSNSDSSSGNSGNSTMKGESIYTWSNVGPCVDLWAPGVDIYGACGSSNRCPTVDQRSYTRASGTSMAAPLAAGVAALYLEVNPSATPLEVSDVLVRGAVDGAIDGSMMKAGTVNKLLNSLFVSGNVGVVAASNGP